MAAHLPPETIDNILQHLTDPIVLPYAIPCGISPCSEQEKRVSAFQTDLRSAALVAREWRLPAQRLIFRKVKITGRIQVERALEAWGGNLVLGSFVRELDVDFGLPPHLRYTVPTKKECVERGIISEEQFVQLLKTTARCTVLRLTGPSFTSFGRHSVAALNELTVSRLVSTLAVQTADFDDSGRLMRQLLRLVTNVEHLHLSAAWDGMKRTVTAWRLREKIALPALRSLTLSRYPLVQDFCGVGILEDLLQDFYDAGILEDRTLNQLESFEYPASFVSIPNSLLHCMRHNLKSLFILNAGNHLRRILPLCPSLAHLSTTPCRDFHILLDASPTSLTKLVLFCYPKDLRWVKDQIALLCDRAGDRLKNLRDVYLVFRKESRAGARISDYFEYGKWVSHTLQAKVSASSFETSFYDNYTGENL